MAGKDLELKLRITADGKVAVDQLRQITDSTEAVGAAGTQASGGLQNLTNGLFSLSMALLAIGSAPDTVIVPSGWRDTEGTPRLYTAAQILAAQQSLLLWGALCDGASQLIAADIDAATDAAEVEAIIAAIPTDPRWPN